MRNGRVGVEDQIDGDPSLTVVHSACPGGSVVVERLIQTAANRLLWIQVRAGDSATGIAVLDSVRTHGI